MNRALLFSHIVVSRPALWREPENRGHLRLAEKPRVKLREAHLIATGAAKYRATWNVSSRTCVDGTDETRPSGKIQGELPVDRQYTPNP